MRTYSKHFRAGAFMNKQQKTAVNMAKFIQDQS
ncbi:Rop family plasmid primer RNA-binding protein, partial [Staphylococcus pseudintermedius]